MDPEAFLDMANQVIKLKMFPYFDIAHSLLCALAVREDLGPGAQAFSRKHPLACWLSTMLVIFAGGMVANGLLGEPILAPLKNSPQLYVATVVWYLVFYTPFDVGYKVWLKKLLYFTILFWKNMKKKSLLCYRWVNSCRSKWLHARWKRFIDAKR